MATRLCCRSLMRQLRIIARHPVVFNSTPTVGATVHRVEWNSHMQTVRSLHEKVFDAQAGLDEQRATNARKLAADSEWEAFSSKSHVRISKRHSRGESAREEGAPKERELTKQLLDETDADTFGNASPLVEEDAGDLAEEEYISRPTRQDKKLQTRDYARIIKEHLNARQLQAAIDVLEQRMLKEDRVKPENYIYNLLISGCAKAGYTRKAFSLFTRMRQRGLKVTGGTYTSLFNACANAPSATDGLERANHLREIALEKGYELNEKNYNAMIKAYGRCGDIKTAFLLADEMMDHQLPVNADTFNFLLQACATDAEHGFRHCLLTWHKMLKSRVQPDYFSFKGVLRCVRDCGFGNLETMEQVLGQILEERSTVSLGDGQRPSNSDVTPDQLVIPSDIGEAIEINEVLPTAVKQQPGQALVIKSESMQLGMPNLLAPLPHLGSLMALSEVNLPHERFLLTGGITGFLDLMKQNNITPDIELFTTMLEVIPPTNAAEKQVISFIRKIGLKADIDFFNILIKKRSMRFDYEGAKEVLSMIRTARLQPDIVTYGVLALGCQTKEAANELLQIMRQKDVRMNIQILGAMLHQGCAQLSFSYVCEIMQISLDEHIKPNDAFLRHLHNLYKRCARAIDARHPVTKSKEYKKGHAKFCDKLRLYNEEQGIAGLKLEDAIKKIKERPYAQYKEAAIEGHEPLKNQMMARKNKIRKYIKKIKVENLKGDDHTTKHVEGGETQLNP